MYEIWRAQYSKRPYLKHLTPEELQERCNNLINLLAVLMPDGKIGVKTGKKFDEDIWIKFTHVTTEMERRYGPYPNGFTNGFVKDAKIVSATFPSIPKSKLAIDFVGGAQADNLYKFTKKKYVEEMISRGAFRISPASYYDDPSLNDAIRDNELVFNGSFQPGLKGVVKTFGSLPSYGRIDYSVKARTNYYVACFASAYTYREFEDFDADACLIVKEPRVFTDRIIQAGLKKLSGYEGFAGNVKYLDPVLCDPEKIDVSFAKHFKYAYQNEYRIIWAPKAITESLEPLFVEIGPLTDICEVIEI